MVSTQNADYLRQMSCTWGGNDKINPMEMWYFAV